MCSQTHKRIMQRGVRVATKRTAKALLIVCAILFPKYSIRAVNSVNVA